MNHEKVLYCYPECAGESFQPSNGTEGMVFCDSFCDQCIHQNPNPESNKHCDILMMTMCYDPRDKEYPKEWVYSQEGWPICTSWQKWDWDDGNPDDPDNPKAPIPVDPDQYDMFPLYPDETHFEKKKEQILTSI